MEPLSAEGLQVILQFPSTNESYNYLKNRRPQAYTEVRRRGQRITLARGHRWDGTEDVTVQEIVATQTVGRQKERSACSLCPEGRPAV